MTGQLDTYRLSPRDAGNSTGGDGLDARRESLELDLRSPSPTASGQVHTRGNDAEGVEPTARESTSNTRHDGDNNQANNPDSSNSTSASQAAAGNSTTPSHQPTLSHSSTHTVREERHFHWVSKEVMLTCFVTAIALMLGHHFWYNSLVGQPIGSNWEQQSTR
jgi:hypothetical protein